MEAFDEVHHLGCHVGVVDLLGDELLDGHCVVFIDESFVSVVLVLVLFLYCLLVQLLEFVLQFLNFVQHITHHLFGLFLVMSFEGLVFSWLHSVNSVSLSILGEFLDLQHL